jgi:hypothetical protein
MASVGAEVVDKEDIVGHVVVCCKS